MQWISGQHTLLATAAKIWKELYKKALVQAQLEANHSKVVNAVLQKILKEGTSYIYKHHMVEP